MKRKAPVLLLLAAILLLLSPSCTNHASKSRKKKSVTFYPAPPDTARVQFLTSFSSSENTIGKQSMVSKFIFGEEEPRPIKKPYGITVHGGKIYICDTGLGGLEIVDLAKNTFEYFFPKGKGQLKLPLNCSVDEDGTLYVADGQLRQVVVFDSSGNYVASFGKPSNFKPTDVCVFGDKVWVSNLANNKVDVFDKRTHAALFSFPEAEKGKVDFLYSPCNLSVTADRVYVSDMGDFRVKLYDHQGVFLSSVGSNGSSAGQFVRPKGIAVDRESNLYVVDAGFENAQIFNREGKVLMFFGGPYKETPGDMWLPAKVAIDYNNLSHFQKYVSPAYTLQYLIFVTNQYGPDKVNVYGFILPKQK
jgi:DNA-binding beta-propeller fold protein YncE